MVSSGALDHQEDGGEDSTRDTVSSMTTAHEDEENVVMTETDPLLPRANGRSQGRCYVPKRYELLFLCFVGGGFMFLMRVNVNMTMAVMTNATYTTSEGDANHTFETCRSPNGTLTDTDNGGEFLWSTHEQELIIAGFFYGYTAFQIPAGWLTDKIGGTRVFGVAMLLSGSFNLLCPIAARAGPMVFLAVRILCGIGEAGFYPSMGSMVARWFPESEFSSCFSIALAGSKFGTFFGTMISGVLSSSDFMGGWPSTYYVFGGVSIIWSFLWMFLIYETPSSHPRISARELNLILSNTVMEEKTSTIKIPMKAIVLSIPVWAIIICSFIGSWANQTIFSNLPIYLKHVQGYDIETIGFLSSLPFIVECIALIGGGMVANRIINSRILTVGNTRKLLAFVGFSLSAVSFFILVYVGCNGALSVVLMTIAVGFNGIGFCGYFVNLMDIAPRLAGSLTGVVNMSSALAGAMSPYAISVFTTNQSDISGWQIVFWISGGLSLLGILVYMTLGSGEEQEWAKASPNEDRTQG